EEWGFIGAAIVVALFVLLVALCLRVALETREPFGRLVATGIAVAFAAQAWQNVAMTMGLSPVTGLPLPFVSFGGSSLVTSWCALGIVLGIAARRVRVVASADLEPYEPPAKVKVSESAPGGSILSRWPV
ncbi:MAG TPA: FtsW/RodA/SpoVE family cell cycle protein, partial [Planctomycetota bacterium]|nr:FtsW/RodA/SpoVE family cell cycle protein [Planctomycetota bacterium]